MKRILLKILVGVTYLSSGTFGQGPRSVDPALIAQQACEVYAKSKGKTCPSVQAFPKPPGSPTQLYTVDLGERPLFIRVPLTNDQVNLSEINAQLVAAKHQLGPDVYYVSYLPAVMVMEHLDEAGTCDRTDPAFFEELGGLFARVNKSPVPVTHIDSWDAIQSLLEGTARRRNRYQTQSSEQVKKTLAPLWAQIDALIGPINDLKPLFKDVPRVPIHPDGHCLNVLQGEKGIRLIDWEMARWDIPYANAARIGPYLSLESQQALVRGYFGHEPTEEEQRVLRLFEPVAIFLRALRMVKYFPSQPPGEIPSLSTSENIKASVFDRQTEASESPFLMARAYLNKVQELMRSAPFKKALKEIKAQKKIP